MKLSDLKKLLAQIESARLPSNPDPEVSFWLTTEVHQAVEKKASTFVDVSPEESETGYSHRTRIGDFSWPVRVFDPR